jgi:hypothetical protein
MFNAHEIIQLEKRWFKYKIKQKSKFYVMAVIVLLALFVVLFKLSSNQFVMPSLFYFNKNKTIEKQKIFIEVPIPTAAIAPVVLETIPTETHPTKKIDPYEFKLIPKIQANERLRTNGALHLNLLNESEEKNIPVKKDDNTNAIKPKKINITMGTIKIDNIKYLKDKFYATSNIMFALMLAEEYYNTKSYNESIKWALTANNINSQDDKSWFWFAKSKVKLNNKDDAIRALRAFLLNNKSNKLETLLHKIESGDAND